MIILIWRCQALSKAYYEPDKLGQSAWHLKGFHKFHVTILTWRCQAPELLQFHKVAMLTYASNRDKLLLG